LAIFHHHRTTTILWPFFQDHPGEPVPEENFWTLWCKGRSTEADTLTIRLGATPSTLTSAHLHHPAIFFTGQNQKIKPIWILMKQEIMGWQWHRLDHMKSFATRCRQITTPAPHWK